MAHDVQLSLNRIACPQLPLPEFLALAAELGMKYVEVRNDFAPRGILDGLSDDELRRALAASGVRILTINALYPFDRVDRLKDNLATLDAMIADARRVDCPHLVMCPFNEPGDTRTAAQRAADLVIALDAYGPRLARVGMVGLVEALGFERSTLRTKRAALEAIRACTHPRAFALVHDTFHHYLSGEAELFPAETGLVHVSGVPRGKPRSAIQDDDDRVLVDERDAMDSRGQVAALLAGGCTAPVSYEPFAPSIRALPAPELKVALQRSAHYLLG